MAGVAVTMTAASAAYRAKRMSPPNGDERIKMNGAGFDVLKTTFFLGRETLIASRQPTMPRWRKGLFAFMMRNVQRATAYFRIPPNRVIEIGVQIKW